MSAAGRDSAVSRKRPLGPAHASPVACCGGGEAGGLGSPKAKRRLFAAGPGSRSDVAAAAAAAEFWDTLVGGPATSTTAADPSCWCYGSSSSVLHFGEDEAQKYSAQQFAPLRDAIVGLASAVRAANAPVEPHPDLYPTVMGVPGFTKEQLLAVLFYLNKARPRGAVFLEMSEPDRALWIEHILHKQEL